MTQVVEPLSSAGTLGSRSSEALRGMVLNRHLLPGQRLNEVELATALGISRGPLREAIRTLATEGLLTIVTHKGAFVRTFRREDLQELYEVRVALETQAIKLAARKASDDELTELGALLERTELALGESPETGYPANLDFHRHILRLSGNNRLQEIATSIHQQIGLARFHSAQVPDRARESLQEHVEIVKHLVERDADGAARLLEAHLDTGLVSAISLFDSTPG